TNKKSRTGRAGKVKGRSGARLNIYIKIDDLQLLKFRLPVMPDLILVELNRKTFRAFQQQQKVVKKFQRKLCWCLPPILLENEMDFFSNAEKKLLNNHSRTWQIGHVGQQLFFADNKGLNLLGDYPLNILNSQGLYVLNGLNVQRAQASIEIDRESLKNLLDSRSASVSGVDLGMTVYATPPLFTARSTASHFIYGQPLLSPRGEAIILHKAWNGTVALAENPFSLLPKRKELATMGLKYAVIDLSRRKVTKKENEEIAREAAGRRSKRKLSTFNYNGSLL
ncbi:MAG: hypothetical protein JRF02_06945, partial [Deltaproteobacteria bacterium]|nr:hypothetical protein [Deltaproteobacteria bacterium]